MTGARHLISGADRLAAHVLGALRGRAAGHRRVEPAITAWLADGLVLAEAAAAAELEAWMTYDPADESAQMYGDAVDRRAAYNALAEIIQRNAFARATAGLNRFKADRASAHADVATLEAASAVTQRHLAGATEEGSPF